MFITFIIFYILFLNILLTSYGVSIQKKTCIITGGNRGIGFNACKQLAATNEWNIIIACRSLENAQKAIESISVDDGRNNIEIAGNFSYFCRMNFSDIQLPL